jgi:hypothetical protein
MKSPACFFQIDLQKSQTHYISFTPPSKTIGIRCLYEREKFIGDARVDIKSFLSTNIPRRALPDTTFPFHITRKSVLPCSRIDRSVSIGQACSRLPRNEMLEWAQHLDVPGTT